MAKFIKIGLWMMEFLPLVSFADCPAFSLPLQPKYKVLSCANNILYVYVDSSDPPNTPKGFLDMKGNVIVEPHF